MATANQIRQVAIVLKDETAALKSAVDAINTVTSTWTVNSGDESLPTAAAVKAQYEAYQAVYKVDLRLSSAITAIEES